MRALTVGAAVAVVTVTTLVSFRDVLRPGREWLSYDDEHNFANNAHLRRGLRWSTARWAWTDGVILGVWEPVALVAKSALVSALGFSPDVFARCSVALHTANVLLLLVAAARLVELAVPRCSPALRWGACSVAAALFAAHPLRVEVVAWASAQSYLLASFFALASTLLYLREQRLASVGCFALAALSKSATVALVGLGLWIDILRSAAWTPRSIASICRRHALAIGVALAAALLALRANVDADAADAAGGDDLAFTMGESEESIVLRPTQRLLRATYAVCWYVAKTAWPSDLGMRYRVESADEIGFDRPIFALAALVFTATSAGLGVALLAARRRRARSSAADGRTPAHSACSCGEVAAATWAAAVGLLLPTLGFVQHGIFTLAADRYSYLPSMLLVPAVGFALAKVASRLSPPRAWALLALGAAAAAALSVGTHSATLRWRSSVTLFEHTVHRDPLYVDALGSLGTALSRGGRLAEATEAFGRALRLKPSNTKLLVALGNAHQHAGQGREAMAAYRKAQAIEPQYAKIYANMGTLLRSARRLDDAAAALAHATALSPTTARYWASEGGVLGELGRADEAAERFDRALELDPECVVAWYNLGNQHHRVGNFDLAAAAFARTTELDPTHADAWSNGATAEKRRGEMRAARHGYEQALACRPTHHVAMYNLAQLELAEGNGAAALAMFQRAKRLAPQHAGSFPALQAAAAEAAAATP